MRKRKKLAELSLRERVGNFVHFSRLKRELAGLILSLDEFEKSGEGLEDTDQR
jgi:hypothetical protein